MNHINFLDKNIYNLLKKLDSQSNNIIWPTIFEYYSAVQLSITHKKPFWVWKDIPKEEKLKAKLPVLDKGIDISDETFTNLGQCKYYSNGNYITYNKISSFLATRVLVGRQDINFNLIRTNDCKIDKSLQSIIFRKDLKDIKIDNQDFLLYCQNVKLKYD
jgi:hypothetical protein